jgi:hypothetical protein
MQRDLRLSALGLPDTRDLHAAPGGWYSSEVLAAALDFVSMRTRGRVEFQLLLKPLKDAPEMLKLSRGAIANVGRHWVALRWLDRAVLLDSKDIAPRFLEWGELVRFATEHPNCFCIVDAVS